jgi:hypothetical protein
VNTANIALSIGVLIAGLGAGGSPAHAQSPAAPVKIEGDDWPWNRGIPVADRKAARDLFLEGNRLFNIPLYTRAAEKYIAALGKWNHPAFHFNLALTEINLGQEVEARQNLEQALKHGEEPLGPDRFKEAQKQLQELEHQLARIRITCPTDGAEVTLDGATLFTGPGSREEWVKVTTHEITAKNTEYVTQSRRVKVSPGKLATFDLSLQRIYEDRPWATWKPWAVVGAGVAIAATGGVFRVVSARKFNDYDNKFIALPCSSMGCTDSQIRPTLKAELTRARLEQQIAVGGYIAGGALAAAGAVLVYLNRPHLVEQGASDAPTPRVTVVPMLSPDLVGAMVTVSR